MELTRRSLLVYGLLLAVWALVLGWQVEEHHRVTEAAKTDLRNRSKDIANTLSAFIRGLRFRGEGAVLQPLPVRSPVPAPGSAESGASARTTAAARSGLPLPPPAGCAPGVPRGCVPQSSSPLRRAMPRTPVLQC